MLSRGLAALAPPEDLAPPAAQPSQFGLLLVCFFLSGLAALVYQTAWTRQFAFVFGTSELAVASVLAAYMGGLALGAGAIGRIAPRIRRPVLVYGLLELAIGLAALAVPYGVAAATSLYVGIFGAQGGPADEGGLSTALFYLACSFAILIVPTALMGATLPLLARHAVRREEEIGRRIAHLYAMNTAGAVVGTIVTGFVLLPAFGLSRTIAIAVGTNVLVFGAAALLARRAPPVPQSAPREHDVDARDPNRWILPLILLSGAVSFTYEVLWTRLLGHVLGGSVYAFATMLATFLSGIAIGSWLASGRAAADRSSAASGFAWAQVGAGLLSLGAYLAIDATPVWVERWAVVGDMRLLVDALVSAAILLPGTICIGATFPLAVRVLARSQSEAGPASARVYAWNTVGAITGAIGTGFFLIPAVGFEHCLGIAVAVNAALALATSLRARPRPRVALAAAIATLVLLVVIRPEPPWRLLCMGAMSSRVKLAPIVYYGVGRSSTVMLQEAPDGWQLSSNGLAEATINRKGVRAGRFVIARWLSNLPAWGLPDARTMLVVGFGGGLALEGLPPNFERVDVVEIEPEILRANERIASERSTDPFADPRVHVIVNDARSALLLTRERYDAIVSQPSHPWTAAASHLYTREFFQLVRDHLSSDGVFVQWMGLGFIDEPLLKTILATLLDVFPHVRIYEPSPGGLLFTASLAPFEPERHAQRALDAAPQLAGELGIHGPEDIAVHFMLDEAGVRALAAGAPVSSDDRNRLQTDSPSVMRSRERFDPGPLLARLDPFREGELRWDRAYLIRRSLASGLELRARALVEGASDPVERSVGLAMLARLANDPAAANAHFRRALEQDPGNREARIGLLRMIQSTGANGEDLVRRFGREPTGSEAALIAAWQHESRGRFDELREQDAELGSIAPHDPAFPAAVRLRAAWRVEDGSAERAREVLALIDPMLPIGGGLGDLAVRARAALQAGLPAGAISSLSELVRKVGTQPDHEPVVRQALRVLEAIPDDAISPERRRTLSNQLRRKLPG